MTRTWTPDEARNFFTATGGPLDGTTVFESFGTHQEAQAREIELRAEGVAAFAYSTPYTDGTWLVRYPSPFAKDD